MTETFAIQSDKNQTLLVEERLFHFCREHNVGSYYSTLDVATLHAVENAIVHGNGCDALKEVSITFGTCAGGVFVEVSDQGNGFDYEQFGQLPTDECSKGAGIFVMKSLADGMSFSDGGRKVRMEFSVNGIEPAITLERISILQEYFSLVAA